MIYRFDNFEFNTELYTLSRGGHTKRLRPKVFEVLLYLLEHRERVVSKQELADRVWPDQFIANSTLESTIRLLRQDLGDSGRTQRIIQTSHGYGYRFAVPVITPEESHSPDNLSQDKKWHCPACRHVNPAAPRSGSRYCVECGVLLKLQCLQCDADNLPHANFCAFCGTVLPPQSVSLTPGRTTEPPNRGPECRSVLPSARASERHAGRAERRQLTVMVCDLVGAATLSESLDMESLHEVLRAYQQTCSEVVRRFDGHIAQNTSTCLWFYFGYPHAHEDDARRAVHTGLGILEALQVLNVRLVRDKRIRLQAQLGIHTGPVVIDERDSGQYADLLPLGITPNIALQIQTVAKPSTVVVSAETARLTEGYFTYHELACQPLEGGTEPIRLRQILGPSGAVGRLEVVPAGCLTQFVGREAEIALLHNRWKQAKEGMGQVVLLSGEAGIGKSRLVQVIKEDIADDNYIVFECRCSPYHQQSAFYPVIDLFRRILQWQGEDTPDEKFKKLEEVFVQYDLPPKELIPLISSLLALYVSNDSSPQLSLTPQQQRQRTLEAILTFVLAVASRKPLLLIAEDLHWVDPSTYEFLKMLVDQTPTASICALFTYRPSFEPACGNLSYLTQISLGQLPHDQVEQMVIGITGGKAVPAEVLQQIVDKTDGVPLFIEELTKTVIEEGLLREIEGRYELAFQQPTVTIPTTLHDSLMARLDRLGEAKHIAQLGGVLGRQFTYELIHAVSRQEETILQRGLDRLVKAGLVYQQGLPTQATYIFKHALVQETAYQSLLKRTRQYYHQQIAQVLSEHFPDTVEPQPELLAHHYTEAGLHTQAVHYWLLAGRSAAKRSANTEALNHFKHGLLLLESLPETEEHHALELDLQMALGMVLIAAKGYGAPEVEQAYMRAKALCLRTGRARQLSAALRGQCVFYLLRARYETAWEIGEQMLDLAERNQNPDNFLDAHLHLGMTLLFLGEFEAAYTHFTLGRSFYNPDTQRSRALTHGTDAEVGLLAYGARALWFLGFADQARQWGHAAYTRAESLSLPMSIAQASCMLTILYQMCREVDQAKQWGNKTNAFASEKGITYWASLAAFIEGWACTQQGQASKGIGRLDQYISALQKSGALLGCSSFFCIQAEAFMRSHQFEASRKALGKALAFVEETGEAYYTAEIYRLSGELTRLQNGSQAEAEFKRASAIARSQKSKSLELRVAISLADLWKTQGKHQDARKLLDSIYSGFTEGFDTRDLQEAGQLLETLADA